MYPEFTNFGSFTLYVYFEDGDVVTTNCCLGYQQILSELNFFREYWAVNCAVMIDSNTGEVCAEFKNV